MKVSQKERRDLFAPHHEHVGAFRSTTIVARCQSCEKAASSYCTRCGRTSCTDHQPTEGLCQECREYCDVELNRRQGRGFEGVAIVFLSLLLMAIGGSVSIGMVSSRHSLVALLGFLLMVAVATAPVWMLLGRQWFFERAFRRLR